jgi:S1-C subfamily serine protease
MASRKTTKRAPPRADDEEMGIFKAGGALLVAALVGGGAAFGIGQAAGQDATTTVVRRVQTVVGASPASLARDGKSIHEAYKEAAPGVVQVVSRTQQGQGLGSGFVIDTAGHIVTNYHVVAGASRVEVSFSDNDLVRASVVGKDPTTDIALLKVGTSAGALKPLPLGDSDRTEVGDAVVAIGNPLGLDRTVTAGIVSALQREITAPNGYAIDKVIQTDAAINHGNSGGPLLNKKGQVIGVNSQIATGGTDPEAGNIGIGFAVPINTVKAVAAQILETGKVEHSYLGVSLAEITKQLAATVRLPATSGVLVLRVSPGSPASRAGIKGGATRVVVDGQSFTVGGDVLTAIDGKAVKTVGDVRSAIQDKRPGESVSVTVKRANGAKTLEVTLGKQPAKPRA